MIKEKLVKGLAIIVALVSVLGISHRISAAEIEEAEMSGTLWMNSALDSYFAQRENEYYGSLDAQTEYALDEEKAERIAFIDSWMDSLSLDVVEAEVSYEVREVLSETADSAKAAVYEWVWIDYICRGYEKVETMGFGTEHIIRVSKESGAVIADSYLEITGFEAGLEADMEILRAKKQADCDMETSVPVSDSVEAQRALSTNYNASLAVAYADRWCGVRTPGGKRPMTPGLYNFEFYYYPGADCCNFVSQCLYAGGMPTGGDWWVTQNTSGGMAADDGENPAYSGVAWCSTARFADYWGDGGTLITSSSQAVAGNPIFSLTSDNRNDDSNHNMLIVGVNSGGSVLVDAHNDDAYRFPLNLSEKVYRTIYLVQ